MNSTHSRVFDALLNQNNLSHAQLRKIPSRSNVNNQAIYEYFCRRNGIKVETLLNGTTLSVKEFKNDKLWLDPLDAYTIDKNAAAAYPGFFHHQDGFFEGLTFTDLLPNLYIIYFRLLPVKTLFRQLQLANGKFNNEYQLHGFNVTNGGALVSITPYAFKRSLNNGQECQFIRGVLSAYFSLHGIRDSKIVHRYCSTSISNLINGVYSKYNIKYREYDGIIYLNDKEVAHRITVQGEDRNGALTFDAYEISAPFIFKNRLILQRGEIYGAPACLLELSWTPLPFLQSMAARFSASIKLRKITMAEMNRQIEHSNQQLFELLEQKQLTIEALESANRQKDLFLSNTAHEIKTPLNGIIGLTESAAAGLPKGSPGSDTLNLVMFSARRLSYLVNDILDFSRMKEGRLPLQIKPVYISPLIKTVVNSVLPLVGPKNLQIQNKIDPAAKFAVLGDENRLYQIFFNLVDNAVKFTEKGTVNIEAFYSDSRIGITVSDTGIGIPPQNWETIFLPYEQGGDGRAQEYGGTGIGLSVVKNLVELQSGRINLKSKPGSGSAFTVLLPAAKCTPEENPPENQDLVFENTLIPAGTDPELVPAANAVWICDDDPVNLKVLENIVSETGFPVYCFSRGEALLKAMNQSITPILILLDVIMPGIDGLEACREIRKRKDSSELPIIMVTARSRTEDMVLGFKAGASDYVTKPVERQELLARIRLHLDLVQKTAIHIIKEKQAKIVETLVSVIGLLGGSAGSNGEESTVQEDTSPVLEDRLEKELAVCLKADGKNNVRVKELLHTALAFGREHRGLFRSFSLGTPRTDTKSALEEAISGLLSIIRSSGNNRINTKCLQLGLTTREAEIAEFTCQGFQNGEIADLLGISENTVKHHLYNIFNKTGADTRTHLVHLLNS